ncbi:MAG: hypothetical protein MJA30_05820 [Cytophagales bacterium]|nr:hypothetical protein [Cytophagales bacterium]
MKQNEDIDNIIYEALSKEEAQFYNQLGEQSILEMALDVYKGRNKWISITSAVLGVVLFAIFVYAAVQFFKVEDTREMLQWMAIGFVCLGTSQAMKVWQWMQMDKNALLREMKRLEVQISMLSKKLAEKEEV